MKLKEPVNANYAAVVVEIKSINQLDNCDNVVGAPLLGYQAIVSKDTVPNTIGILFPAETQLSDEFCRQNNLYRHAEKNLDPTQKGYIEDNRRVKAMKFRGHRSDALFMPLSSLVYTGIDPTELKVKQVFDVIGDQEICRKYLAKVPQTRVEKNKAKAKERRVDEKYLPAHFDTDNYFRNVDSIPAQATVIVTAKLHGTSVRLANTLVARKLSWLERVAKRLGVNVQETEYDYIAGSRRVIKDPKDNDQNHFYKTDIWTASLDKVQGVLPQGFIVYGELVGWTEDGSPIQTNYTYGLPQGTNALYVYRVAQVNPQGLLIDLSWDQVKEFCKDRGLLHVPELTRGKHGSDIDEVEIEQFLDRKFNGSGYESCPPLSDPRTVDEGVCIRVDGLVPYILKAKSPLFFEHETSLYTAAEKGEEVVDLESEDG